MASDMRHYVCVTFSIAVLSPLKGGRISCGTRGASIHIISSGLPIWNIMMSLNMLVTTPGRGTIVYNAIIVKPKLKTNPTEKREFLHTYGVVGGL